VTAITYRPADRGTPDARTVEHNFIVDAWVRSYNDSWTNGIIQIEDWFPFMIPTVEKILDKPDVETVVACIPGVTDHIADVIGFIVADVLDVPPLVYYVFVKEHYRRCGRGRLWPGVGVGRGLFEAIGIDPARPMNYVCSTEMCRKLERKIPMSRWKQSFGRYPKHERRSTRR
jgi:hypothetical protein